MQPDVKPGGVYYLRNSNIAGDADLTFAYGSTDDIPVTGDWGISRKRSPDERPYAVIKTVFKSVHTMVTTIARVHAKMIFAAMSFNISLIRTFKHRGVI
jgi:hypothetical protein